MSVNDEDIHRLEQEVLSHETKLQFLSEKRDLLTLQLDLERSKQKFQNERLITLMEKKERLTMEAKAQEQPLLEMRKAVEAYQERLEKMAPTLHLESSKSENGMPVESSPHNMVDAGEDNVQNQSEDESPLKRSSVDQSVGASGVPVPSIHCDKSLLDSFWNCSGSENGLFAFLPCLDSLEVIRKAMDVNALETIALDTIKPESSQHRAESLKNTCLDIFSSIAPKRYDHTGEAKRNTDRDECTVTPRNKQTGEVDPDVALCPYELAGVCADTSCPYQHLQERAGVSKALMIARERIPLPPLKLPAAEDSQEDASVGTPQDVESPSRASTLNRTASSDDITQERSIEVLKAVECAWINESDFISLPRSSEEHQDPDAVGIKSLYGRDSDEDSDEQSVTFYSDTRTEAKTFWWMLNEDLERNGERDRHRVDDSCSLIEWLYRWGGFQVVRRGSRQRLTGEPMTKRRRLENAAKSRARLELLYELNVPVKVPELIAFFGKVVDCIRVVVHAGRFDLARALQSLLQQVTSSSFESILQGENAIQNNIQGVLQLFSELLTRTVWDSFDHNSERQGIFYCAFDTQVAFAMLSEYMRLLYVCQTRPSMGATLGSEWKTMLEEISTMFLGPAKERTQNTNSKADRERVLSDALRLTMEKLLGVTSSDALLRGETEKEGDEISAFRELLANVRASKSVLSSFLTQDEIGLSLQRTLASFLACAKRSTLHSSSLHKRRQLLKNAIVLGYLVIGIVHTVTTSFTERGGPFHDVSRTATLAELDSGIKRITMFLARQNSHGSQVGMELSGLAVAPLQAISVSLSACIGLYGKTQRRLEYALFPFSRDQNMVRPRDGSVVQFSELLWSQLVALRSTLPAISSDDSSSKSPVSFGLPDDISHTHMQIASHVTNYGLHLNHITLHGDWNLVAALKQDRHDNAISTSSATRQTCHSIVSSTFGDESVDNISRGTADQLAVVNLQSIPLAGRPRNEMVACDRSTFPMSIVLAGNNIKSLCLKHCSLTQLPETIGLYFENLQVLDISSNKLSRLPSTIGRLKHLKCLYASQNRIKTLPPSIVDCVLLEVLDLRDNVLETLPTPDLPLKLTKLKSLLLDRLEPDTAYPASADST